MVRSAERTGDGAEGFGSRDHLWGGTTMTEFRLLGRLEMLQNTGPVPLTPPKVRQVLALLLLRAQQVVPADDLIAELWGENPPRTATSTLHTYVCRLRKTLACDPELGAGALQTGLKGYLLQVEPASLDLGRFRRLIDEAAAAEADGRHAEGLAAVDEALALWRGPGLADVPCGPVLEAYAAQLAEERLRAYELRFELAFALGLHREQIAPLRSLIALYPLHEWFHGRLIEALGRAGRRSEALAAYQHLHRLLNQELGLSPSLRVQRLQHQVLRAG
jgi:SARP family transcriptional regulator, regulator of embCAB operon